MTEMGTVLKLIGDKPFGFIRRPDGSDLFFHFSKYPRGIKPAVGDELEYEVSTDTSKPAGKQTYADHVKVVKKGSDSAPAAATTTTTPAPAGAAHSSPPPAVAPTAVPAQVQFPSLKGRLIFFTPKEVERDDPKKPDAKLTWWQIRIDVEITNQTDGKPVAEVPVSLKCGDEPITFPFRELVSNYDGKVTFIDEIPKDSLMVYYKATATGTDRIYTIPDYFDPKDPSLLDPATTPVRIPVTTTPTTPVVVDPSLTSLVSTAPDGARVIDVSSATAISTVLPAVASPPDPAALTAPTPAAPATTTLAAAVSPAPLSPASAPPPPPPEPDNLIVNIEAFPNAEGFFLTTVSTRLGNDPVKGKFRFFSGNKMEAKLFDGNSIGTGLSVSYETDDDGTIEFLLNCDANQTRIVFKLQNGKGKEVAKLFCKPPAFKEPA